MAAGGGRGRGGGPGGGNGSRSGAAPAAAAPVRAARPAAPVLVFSPAPYDYGQVSVGKAATQTFTLVNSGRKATGQLRMRLSGPAAFAITSDHCRGTHLRPGGACTIMVRFAPASASQLAATLTAASQGHHTSASDALTGTGTSLGVAPAQIYWTSFDTIWVANLDGSSPHAIITGLTEPLGVAVNTSNLYWADTRAGTINEASRDGTGPHAIVTGRPARSVWRSAGATSTGPMTVTNPTGRARSGRPTWTAATRIAS